jgi:hypothetical protein
MGLLGGFGRGSPRYGVELLTMPYYPPNNGGGGGSANVVSGEVPTGPINGTNKSFSLSKTPLANTLKVYLNGARQKTTIDYTNSGATITFASAPLAGPTQTDIILADYNY